MDKINEYNLIEILKYLDSNSIQNLIIASYSVFYIILQSPMLLRRFILQINCKNFKIFSQSQNLCELPIEKASIDFKNSTNIQEMLTFVTKYSSIETLELNYLKTSSQYFDIINVLTNLPNLKSLKLSHCLLDGLSSKALSVMPKLESISFEKCNDNVFKLFRNQNSLKKIYVTNKDWSWNGFPHDVFNDICKNCKNLNHLVLKGAGTGSYFDSDEFPFKITKLETSMITFHWYVGIRHARVDFLESQKGSLKELTIHELPYDFDGGKVLKYIIDEMNLVTFYYGKIPLILNGQKQKIKEFTASEIQITSAYEILRQFEVDKFILKLSSTDIASDAVEKIVNPPTDLFKNLKEFEVIDNSSYRGIFGVFLGLYKNLKNIQKLTLRTQDRNINTILDYLPKMLNLEEILLTSTAARATERYESILKLGPNLNKLFIPTQSTIEALKVFESTNINIYDIETLRCLKDCTSNSLALPARGGHCQLTNQEPTKQATVEIVRNKELSEIKKSSNVINNEPKTTKLKFFDNKKINLQFYKLRFHPAKHSFPKLKKFLA